MPKNNIKKYLNKGISTPMAFLIIILLALVVGIMAWYLGQNKDNNQESLQATSPTVIPEATPIKDLTFGNFIVGLGEILESDCTNEKIYKTEYEGEYAGFPWINKDREIELMKGYHIIPTTDNYSNMSEDCKGKILDYLGLNLVSNIENTSERVLAFEKENIRCLFYTGCSEFECLDCGDASQNVTPEAYSGIYHCLNLEMTPGKSFSVSKVVGDFAIAGTIYYAILLKKTDDGWINLDETQDDWECEVVFEHEVPPSLIGNSCMFYETTREVWRYNEELGEWGKWYHIDSPQDKE